MWCRPWLLALASSSLLAGAERPAPTSAWQRPDLRVLWEETVGVYERGLRQHGIVGSSLWLVHDGEVVARARYGWQDRAQRRPVDDETIYHWASITKTLTGIAIMQLREKGRLGLDDPLLKYLPELRAVHNRFSNMSAITLRHLLSHSAGFRSPTWTWGGEKDWHPFEPPSWKQLEAMLPYTEVLFPPGSRYSYSNPGIVYLGQVLETLTGDDYEVYVTKNVFMPLGLGRSFFDRAPYHLLPHRSHSYLLTDEGLNEARFDFDTGVTVSNGGWNAPLGDLARYVAFLVGDPGRQAVYDAVLPRKAVEEMFAPGLRADERDRWVGLTFFRERRRGLDLVTHTGDQNGFLSRIVVHLPSRSGYVVAFNTDASSEKLGDGRNTRALDRALADHFAERVFPALVAGR